MLVIQGIIVSLVILSEKRPTFSVLTLQNRVVSIQRMASRKSNSWENICDRVFQNIWSKVMPNNRQFQSRVEHSLSESVKLITCVFVICFYFVVIVA